MTPESRTESPAGGGERAPAGSGSRRAPARGGEGTAGSVGNERARPRGGDQDAQVEENKVTIRRYYEEIWNRGDLSVADELIAPDIVFRGSLAARTRGVAAFKEYVAMVRRAFPDFSTTIEDLIGEGDKVVARLTHRGTHKGDLLFGIDPTQTEVTYLGISIFRLESGKIVDGWVVGDTLSLMRQLATASPRVPLG
jgi:predicted ester cyclase